MERQSLRSFYGRQIFKGALFASTALVLPVAASRPAAAQLAPTTTPQGGVVVGGAASIAQGNASTTVTQTSQNAAINWQSFNLGAAAKVQFNQPNAAAIALNRVVGGNLSQINGQINANGQIVLINQSGVVFGKGAQVNAESVVVSTSDIATSDFMAGKLNFTGAPKPGAQIINNGAITARDAGLVGLVAPQVANNGLITATLGQVVLAGASAFTLDLYGDRLISLDVTQAVRAVDVNGQLVPALVINNGAILADGGKITLTAQDADALVTQLINAGGTIRADTVGSQTGAISVQGIGGNISIAGNLLARGLTAGTKGGTVQALTTGTVSVAPGALIDVSGSSGGGYAAIGTDMTRAQAGPTDITAPKASAVNIAAGAAIHADATGLGNAGTVTVLSQNTTDFAGAITARGGGQGGDGGLTELSSDGVIHLSGTVLDTAIDGQPGEILLDPATLIVTIGGASSTSASDVAPSYLDGLGGNIVLSASSLIDVLSPVDMTSPNTSLSLISSGNITIAAGITVTGSLYIDAAAALTIAPEQAAGTLTDPGGLFAANIFLNAGNDFAILTQVSTSGTLQLDSSGGVAEGDEILASPLFGHPSETIYGGIDAAALTDDNLFDGPVSLGNTANNSIATLLDFTVASGALDLYDSVPLVIGNDVFAQNAVFLANGGSAFGISITGNLDIPGELVLDSTDPILENAAAGITTGALALFGNHSAVSLAGAGNAMKSLGTVSLIDTLFLQNSGVLTIASPTTIGSAFTLQGGGLDETGPGDLDVPLFSGLSLTGDALLTNLNTIATLAGFSGAGDFALNDRQALKLTGDVTAENISLSTPWLNLQGNALTAGTAGTLALTADTITAFAAAALAAPGGTIMLAPQTTTDDVDISGAAVFPGTLVIGANLLKAVETSGLAELVLGGPGQSGNVNLGDATITDINLGTAALDIETTGAIAQSAITLAVGTLEFSGAGYGEAAAGTLIAGLVAGNGGTITGNVLLNGAGNTVASISNLTLQNSGTIALDDTQSSLSAGNLRAGIIALDAKSLTLDGAIAGESRVTLDTAGTIFQSAGALMAGTLTGTAGGAITLGDDANSFGTLGTLSAGGAILLDSAAFQIAGTVITPGTLTLAGAGATELAGSGINAAALTSDGTIISGNVNLSAGSNTIGLLTNFLVGSGYGLNLDDTGLLNLAATVSAGHADITADTLALGGDVDVTGLLSLGATDGLTQTGGTLDIGTLASAGPIGSGDVSLLQSNDIGTLGNFIVGAGGFTLTNISTLDIEGVLSVATGNEALFTLPGLTEDATGAIQATTLAGTGTFGDILLTSSLNQISTLSGLSLTGNFALNDADALTLDGLIDTGAANSVSFGGDSVTEDSNGTIIAGTLGGVGGGLTGDAILTQANEIGAVDGLNLGGTLDLTDTRGVSIGNVQAAAATFSNGTASSLDITGFLSVAGTLLLDFTDATLLESGGSITATELDSGVPAIASAVLEGNNHIATLGAFDATGTFDLTDAAALTLTNGLTADAINLADSNALDIDSLLRANEAGIALAAPNIAIGTTGTIDLAQAGQLLSVAANHFSNAGTVSAPAGTFAIAPYDDGTIDLGGTQAGALDLAAADFDIANLSELVIGAAAGHTAAVVSITAFSASTSIALVSLYASVLIEDDGLLDANAIAISGGNAVENSGGTVDTGTLEGGGPLAGNVSLAAATNTIDTLGALTLTNGALTLNDQAALDITGAVTAQDITLEDPRALGLGAPLSVANGGIIDLLANALTDTAAGIDAGATGTVAISPDSTGTVLDLGGDSAGGLELTPVLLALIHAGTLDLSAPGGEIYDTGEISFATDSVFLTGTGLNFGGTLAGPGLLSLVTGGVIEEGPGAVLDFATIAGVGGSTGLGGNNTIGTIGNFSASGNIILNDYESLVIDGLVQTSFAISLEGDYFREVSGGTIAAATLNSGGTEIGGDVFLTNANEIALLTDVFVNAGGTLDFVNGQALTIGDVTAPTATLTAPSETFAGAFNATGLLDLQTPGGVTETTGTIGAATLAGRIGDDAFLTGPNAIVTLGNLSLTSPTGTLDLTDATALTIAGPAIAPIITLAADGIDFAGNLTAGTELFLAGAENVTQSAGIITAGTVATAGTIGGAIALLGANLIGTLGGITAAGNIALANAQTLAIAGQISTTGTLTLDNTAGVTEIAGGGIDAAALSTGTGAIGGALSLGNANTIATLANIALTGDFLLSNSSALIIAGTLATPSGDVTFIDPTAGITETTGLIDAATLDTGGTALGGNLRLGGANTIATLGDLTLAGNGTFALADNTSLDIAGMLDAALFSLTTPDAVSETGKITLGTLAGSIGGNAILTFPNNAIGTLANLTMGSAAMLDLTDAATLTLAGFIDAPQATFNAPGLVFDGTINAGATLALTGSSITTEGTEGDIIVTLLTSDGSIDGSVFLLGTNAIGTIGNFTVSPSSTFALNNGALLTAAGPLTGGFITLSATALDITGALDAPFTTLSAGAITIDGNIFAADTLDLQSSGTVTGAGAIDTGLLTTGLGQITGDFALTGANTIGALGNILVGGSALINDPGTSLDIDGKLAVNGPTLALQDPLGIVETIGTIIAETLTSGSATDGNVFLLGPANTIAALGNFTLGAGDTLALDDTGSLDLTGPVNAAFATFTVPTLAIGGTIASTSIAFLNDGLVTETGAGLIDTRTITSADSTDGSIILGNKSNIIGTVAGVTIGAGGTLAVLSAGLMSLDGTITAPFATFSSGGLDIDGVLNIGSELALGSTGAITEAADGGGLINAATAALISDGPVTGPVALLAANRIGTLGAFTADSAFTFDDAIAYAIDGQVSAASTMTLRGAGFTEFSGGAIDAATLTSAGTELTGGVMLNGANKIATLTNFGATGDVELDDSEDLTLAGTIRATTIALLDRGNISQTSGAILADELTSDDGVIGGSVILNAAANRITALGSFAAANLALDDAANLTIAAPVDIAGTLALADAGLINQTAGTISAGTLTSDGRSVAEYAQLDQPGNQIGAIGNFTGGGLALIDDTNLALTGLIDTGDLYLQTGAFDIIQSTGSIVTNQLDASGNIISLAAANTITTLGPASATDLLVNGVAMVAGPVDADNATITSPGNLQIAGDISAATTLLLSGGATLTQTSGTITAADEVLTGGQIDLAGIDLAAATLSATAQDAINQTAGLFSAGNIDLSSRLSDITQNPGAQMNAQNINLTGGQFGAVTIAGGLSAAQTIALYGAAGITDDATLLQAANATISSPNGVILNGNNFVTGNLTARGDLIQQQTGTIQAGNVTLYGNRYGIILNGSVAAQTAALHDYGGYGAAFTPGLTGVELDGNISVANSLDIASGAGIYLTGGLLHAGSLTGVSTVDPTNRIILDGALLAGAANLTASGGITLASLISAASALGLTSGADLDQTGGIITAQSANLAAGGAIALDGTSRIAGNLDLQSAGNITAPGDITAGTLTGRVTGPGDEQASFMGENQIGTIGSFVMRDSTFALNDAGPLTLVGPLVANAVSLTATGLLTLEGSTTGGLFIAGAREPTTQIKPGNGDSSITVLQAAGGAMPELVQTGTFYVDSGPLAGQYPGFANMPATLFFTMSPDGNIIFEPAPPDDGGLIAPSIDGVFSPGTGGTISGNVDLASLLLLSGKATDLTGMLDGLSGQAASGKGSVVPFPKPVFQFNACPIGSVNCVILPIETLPPVDPLQNFDIAQRKKKKLDKNVALPGVATRDF